MEFFGQHEHTIDGKGRLVLPSAFRDAFADGGFVTIMGRSVGLFTEDGWVKHRRRLQDAPGFDRDAMSQVMAFTSQFKPDAQHRITIVPSLSELLGLGRTVAVVGQGSHVAIYPAEAWRTKQSAVLSDVLNRFDELEFL